jgi:hypothetical protein
VPERLDPYDTEHGPDEPDQRCRSLEVLRARQRIDPLDQKLEDELGIGEIGARLIGLAQGEVIYLVLASPRYARDG